MTIKKPFRLKLSKASETEDRSWVLVTGALSSIGKALCHRLAACDTNLILSTRNAENLNSFASEMADRYPQISLLAYPLDFGSLESVVSFCHKIEVSLSGLVLMPPRIAPSFETLPEAAVWEAVCREVLIHPVELLRGLLSKMNNQALAKVVIISGVAPSPSLSHYALNNSLRSAWISLSNTLASSLGQDGICINTVTLGGVLSRSFVDHLTVKAENSNLSVAEQIRQDTFNVPLRKYAKPEEVAEVIHQLLGPFSDHLTGQNIVCDGGVARSY